MNHFETRLMVLSQTQKVDSKLFMMANYPKYFDEKETKMATEIVQILDFFLRNEFFTLAFKVLAFVNDLKFCTEVREYH